MPVTPSRACADGAAQRDQDVRPGELDLPLDEGLADHHFLRRRRAVAGRAPGHDVGDVDVAGAAEADGRQHAVEELPRHPDEGQALTVLVRAGRFPHQHDARGGVAVGEAEVLGGLLQRAAVEGGERLAQLVEGGAAARDLGRRARHAVGGLCRRGGGPRGLRVRRGLAARFSARRGAAGSSTGGGGAAGRSAALSAKRSCGASSSAQSTPASRWKARMSASSAAVRPAALAVGAGMVRPSSRETQAVQQCCVGGGPEAAAEPRSRAACPLRSRPAFPKTLEEGPRTR